MIPQTRRRFRYFTYIKPALKIPIIKTYGSLILTVAALVIFILFAIKPTIETIIVLQKELENQKEILQKLNQKSENLSLARQNFQAIDPNKRSRVGALVPKHAQVGATIKALEQLAVVSQASISALQFQPITIEGQSDSKSSSLVEILFTYNVEGTFDTHLLILGNLKRSLRLLSIDQLTFSKIEGGMTLLMQVSGKAYYLK